MNKSDEKFWGLLTEEMGIIRQVQNDAQMILYCILGDIEKTRKTLPSPIDMSTYKKGEFEYQVTSSFDSKSKTDIKVCWYYYSFADKQYMEEQMHNIPNDTYYNTYIKQLSVVVTAIKGKVERQPPTNEFVGLP